MSTSLNTSTAIEIRSAIVGDPLVVTPDTTVSEAIAKMSELRTRCYAANDAQSHSAELHAEIRPCGHGFSWSASADSGSR